MQRVSPRWTTCLEPLNDPFVKLLKVILSVAIVAGSCVAPARGQMMPDFHLPDVNPGSTRNAVTAVPVSPRDYLHQVTAWYFAHEG